MLGIFTLVGSAIVGFVLVTLGYIAGDGKGEEE